MSAKNSQATSPEAVVRAMYAAWDTVGFIESYKIYMHDDVIMENPGGAVFHGLEMLIKITENYNERYKRPYARIVVKNLAVNGNTVLTERDETCYNRETGDTFSGFVAMSAFVVENGKITRWADYFDPTPYKVGSALPDSGPNFFGKKKTA